MIRKIKHLIKALKALSIIIYINYLTVVQISHQITLFISFIDKLNLRLIRAFQYLFKFNLILHYKNNKKNVIFDALFKLQIEIDINVMLEKKQIVFENLYDNSMLISKRYALSKQISIYYITLIKINDDFKERLVEVYTKDP